MSLPRRLPATQTNPIRPKRTDTASLTSFSHPFRLARGSIGKAVSDQELKLDENSEILARGAFVCYCGRSQLRQ
jgi:hypothetical protein